MSFYVEPAEDCVAFEDGWKVFIKREFTAGDQEDLDEYILGYRQADGMGVARQMRMGNLKALHLLIIRVVSPIGEETRPTFEQVRRMDRLKAARLIYEVDQRNRPLTLAAILGQETSGEPTTTTEA